MYWPSQKGTSIAFEEFKITLLDERKEGMFVERKIRLTLMKTTISLMFDSSDSISDSDDSSRSPSLMPKKVASDNQNLVPTEHYDLVQIQVNHLSNITNLTLVGWLARPRCSLAKGLPNT